MISVSDAITARTEAEVQGELDDDLVARGVDAAGLSPYSVTEALPRVVAKGLSYESAVRADVARAGFLELLAATPGADAWVDKIVRAWYEQTRLPATKAKWLFRVTASSAVGSITAPARTLLAEAGGVLFENSAEVSISGGQRRLCEFEARVAGAASNILAGAVTGFRVGLAGLSVSNVGGSGAALLFAGRDAESNVNYIARGRARFAAKAPGGARAIYLVWVHEAFTAAGLDSSITKIGPDDANPNGPGSTDIYLANATGPATPTEISLVNTYLQERRGLGTGPLRVLAAPARVVAIAGTLHSTSATALTEALAKWTALARDIPLGGGPRGILYLDAIRGAVLGPDGVPGVYKFAVTEPAADIRMATFDVVTFDTSGVQLAVG